MVKSSPICQHMSDAFKLMPVPLCCQPPHLGLLPGLATHFCILLRHGGRDIAPVLSLLRWQLLACKTKHALVPSQCHTANSATSIFESLQILNLAAWFTFHHQYTLKFAVKHSTTFGSSYAPGPFIRKINFTVSPQWCELP